MGGKFYLGHLLRVPVYLSFEAIFLAAFGFYHYANGSMLEILLGITALLLTIVLHELGHALVAQSLHMNNVAITISALGGYCSYSGEPPPWRKILITSAGPLSNFALAALSWVMLDQHIFPADNPLMHFFLTEFLLWNLLLGCLNSFPLYPLDGGQVAFALAKMMTRRLQTAVNITLALAVISAVVLVGIDAYFRGGTPSLYNIVLVIFLLFTAFSSLR